jgi:hypothetical protein
MAVFEAEPDNGFLLSELCERVYRGINRIEKKHRGAVARAAYGIPWLDHMKRETLGGEVIFYNPASVLAYGMARLKADTFGAYERHSDPRFTWNHPRSEADFRAMLAPGGDRHKHIVEGGAWWRDAKKIHAKLSGDEATYRRLKGEQEEELSALTKSLCQAFGYVPSKPERERPPIVGYQLYVALTDGTSQKQDFKCRRAANKALRALDEDSIAFFRIERIRGVAEQTGTKTVKTDPT